MNKLVSTIVLTLSLMPSAYADSLTITTGGAGGTYTDFGNDIAAVAKSNGINLDVVPSDGSIENLERILGYQGWDEGKYYQLAIIQEDALTAIRAHAKGHDLLEDIVRKVAVIMPLYDEELHIVAKRNRRVEGARLERFNQLEDLTFATGPRRSGTHVTYQLLADLMGIDTVPLKSVETQSVVALDQVKEDDLDAALYVAGAPVGLYQENIGNEDDLTLLEIDPSESFFAMKDNPYKSTTIGPEEYPWLAEAKNTISVSSLLVAYDYSDGANCEAIRRLTAAVLANLDKLRSKPIHHKKWAQVDPARGKDRDDLSKCAQPALDEYLSAKR